MYFIAYDNGRKVCDGYAPSTEAAIALFPGEYQQDGALFAETKWIRTDQPDHGFAVYVRPHNDPPGCLHKEGSRTFNTSTSQWDCSEC